MNRDDLQKALLQAFAEEGPELFSKAENAIFKLESEDESKQPESIESLKRALHSLKGSASAIGRSDIRDVSHAMEDLLFSNDFSPSAYIDRLHEGLNYLRTCISDPVTPDDPTKVLSLLSGESGSADLQGKIKDDTEDLNSREEKTVAQISSDSEMQQDLPSPDISQIHDETPDEIVKNDIEFRENATQVINETIRVAVDKIEGMQSTVGELVAIRLQQEDALLKLSDIQQHIVTMNGNWRNLKHDVNDLRKFLPNSVISKMDSKVASFTSEMKTIQSRVFHLSTQMGNQTGQLSLLSDEMDGGLKAIRMMPLGPFLESYRSVARDAAKQLGKSVVLQCIEKGVEIDRLILQKIKEPILHIVRNCVSHGLESVEERNRLGKPETGNIAMMAELDGDFVCLRVSDDGSGFNKKKIIDKAVRLGLISFEDTLSDNELLDLVSRPGFSTSDTADKVSGRGVGMDVVASTLSELGGSMELESNEGFGTCFTIRVPSSMATSQGLILQVGQQRYGIALDTVERIVRSSLDKLSQVDGKQVIFIDEEPISVTSLSTILEQVHLDPKDKKIAKPIVIIKTGNQRLALMVDDIPGEIPMIITSLGPQFDHISIYSGGAILSDGVVLPVLDARHLVNMVSANHSLRLAQIDEDAVLEDDYYSEEVLNKQGIIVVVDDSITTRTLERNILEAAGYTVAVATDGIEALDLLMIEDNVSLLVTDLEMPRMNGFELCKSIRSGRHSHLPIIMVTSVGDEKEQRKGLEAGADAYIVKNDFQQETFLNTVKRLAL